jgi:hypothetical protein
MRLLNPLSLSWAEFWLGCEDCPTNINQQRNVIAVNYRRRQLRAAGAPLKLNVLRQF